VGNYIQLASYNSGMSVAEMEEKFRGQVKTPVLADVYWREGAKLLTTKNTTRRGTTSRKFCMNSPVRRGRPRRRFIGRNRCFIRTISKTRRHAYESFLQGFPGNANTGPGQFRLGVCYFSLNNFERSAAVFEEFSQTFPFGRIGEKRRVKHRHFLFPVGRCGKNHLDVFGLRPALSGRGRCGRRVSFSWAVFGKGRPGKPGSGNLSARSAETAGVPPGPVFVGPPAQKFSEPVGEKNAYEQLALKVSAKSDPYRIAGLLALADIYLAANDAEGALAVYGDVLKKTRPMKPAVRLAQQQMAAIRAAHGGWGQ
jgi:hypothetical protein